MALVRANDGLWEELKNKTVKVLNQTVTFHRAYAVWMPFSLPGSKVISKLLDRVLLSLCSSLLFYVRGQDEDVLNADRDIISQNRFQDNEVCIYLTGVSCLTLLLSRRNFATLLGR